MKIDQIAYWLKRRWPAVFKLVEFAAGYATAFLNRKAIRMALEQAPLEGTVLNKPALLRILGPSDLDDLSTFFNGLTEDRLTYFRPHGFSQNDLSKVLGRPYFIAYGLFVGGRLQGYSLFKLYPGKKAFIGRILPKELSGCGLGKFLSLYLQWQSRLIGFRMRSTISLKNFASLESHKAVGGFEILGDLPNGYTLIEFPPEKYPMMAPKLEAVAKHSAMSGAASE